MSNYLDTPGSEGNFIQQAFDKKDKHVIAFLKAYSGKKINDYLFNAVMRLPKEGDFQANVNQIYDILIDRDPKYFSAIFKQRTNNLKILTETLSEAVQKGNAKYIKWCIERFLNPENATEVLYGLLELASNNRQDVVTQLLQNVLKVKTGSLPRLRATVGTPERIEIREIPEKEKKKATEKKDTTEKQQLQAAVAMPDFDFHIDVRLFSQIENDYQISGSTLEGNTFKHAASYINALLHHIIKNKTNPHFDYLKGLSSDLEKGFQDLESFKTAESLIENCIDAGHRSELSREEMNKIYEKHRARAWYGQSYGADADKEIKKINHDRKIETRAQYTKKITALLETRESILLPSGYIGTKENPGHAMLIKIEKINAKKEAEIAVPRYRVTVFNTGNGLEYGHRNFLDQNKIKYCPARVFEKVDLEGTSSLIENVVLAPQTNPAWWNEPESEHADRNSFNAEKIYEAIDKFKPFEVDALKYFPHYMTPQRGGSCASKVFSPYFRSLLTKQFPLYKHALKDITNFYFIKQTLEQKGNIDYDSIAQLEFSLQNYSRFLKKLDKKKKYSEDFIHASHDRLQAMNRDLAKMKERYENEQAQAKAASVVTRLVPSESYLISGHRVSVSDTDKLLEISAVKQNIIPLESVRAKEITEESLVSLQKKIQEFSDNKQNQEAISTIEEYFFQFALPIPKFEKLGNYQLQQIITQLNKIQSLYVTNHKARHGNITRPETIITNMALFLATIRALESTEKNIINGFQVEKLVNDNIKICEEQINSLFFNCYDPSWLPQLQDLRLEIKRIKETYGRPSGNPLYDYAQKHYPNLVNIAHKIAEREYRMLDADSRRFRRFPGQEEAMQKILNCNQQTSYLDFWVDPLLKESIADKELVQRARDEFVKYTADQVLATAFKDLFKDMSEKINGPLSLRYPRIESKVVQAISERNRITNPNEIQKVLKEKLSATESDLLRRLLHLRSKPENQIFSSIEFFRDNLVLLCQKTHDGIDVSKDYQLLLHCNLFEPGILPKELKSNKNLESEIISFLETGIKKLRENGCLLPAGAFLYEQALLLLNYLPDNKALHNILSGLRNETAFFEHLEKTLPLPDEKRLTYGRLCKTKALSLISEVALNPFSLDKKKLKEFYVSYFKSKQLNFMSPIIDDSTKVVEAKIKEKLAHFKLPLSHLLEDPEFTKDVFFSILEQSHPESFDAFRKAYANCVVSGDYPLYALQNKENNEVIKINLEEGLIYLKGTLKPGYLPEAVRTNEYFKDVFGDINPKALIAANQEIFEFEVNGLTYRVVFNAKEEGRWGKFYSKPEFLVKTEVDGKITWCRRLDLSIYTREYSSHFMKYYPASMVNDYNWFEGSKGTFLIPKGGNKGPFQIKNPTISIFTIE